MKSNFKLNGEEFKEIYSKVPRLCVELVIENKDGVLMTKRALESWFGLWHLPGGTVLYGETIKDAAKRIAKEELGAKIGIKGLVGFAEYQNEEKIRGFGFSVGLMLLCSLLSLDIKLDSQASEYKFFKILPKEAIPEHKHFLEGFLGQDCDDPGCKEHP